MRSENYIWNWNDSSFCLMLNTFLKLLIFWIFFSISAVKTVWSPCERNKDNLLEEEVQWALVHILCLWEKLGDSKLLAWGHRAPQKTGKEQFRQDLSPGDGAGGWVLMISYIFWPVFHRLRKCSENPFLMTNPIFWESEKSYKMWKASRPFTPTQRSGTHSQFRCLQGVETPRGVGFYLQFSLNLWLHLQI